MEEVTVFCEECDATSIMYARNSRTLNGAAGSVSVGWCVWREVDGEIKYLCPKHTSQEFKDRHQGEFAMEA